MPVAVGPEAAVFVYIDPGMGTRTELDCWREAHRPLWQALRECGWRTEAVAVAWEQELLDRAERVMRSWVGRDLTVAGRELLILRWAVSSADRETVERYGGLNAVLKKISQLKQATPEPQGQRKRLQRVFDPLPHCPGRRAARPPAPPMPHRQHPRQQLPHASARGTLQSDPSPCEQNGRRIGCSDRGSAMTTAFPAGCRSKGRQDSSVHLLIPSPQHGPRDALQWTESTFPGPIPM